MIAVSEAVEEPNEHDAAEGSDDTTPAPSASVSDEDSRPAEIDVAGIESDLDGVQAALTRLAEGTYWTDEVTGAPIPADVLAANPLARRA